MCEILVDVYSRHQHPQGMSAFSNSIKRLATTQGYADLLPIVLNNALRETNMMKADIKKIKMQNHMFLGAEKFQPKDQIWTKETCGDNQKGTTVSPISMAIALPGFFEKGGVFDAIATCNSLEPFDTRLMEIVIHYMWESFGRRIYTRRLITYCCLLFSFTAGVWLDM